MNTKINVKEEGIELISTNEACELLQIHHAYFFRVYSKELTRYINAERNDKRHYWDKNEILREKEKRNAKPKIVVIKN